MVRRFLKGQPVTVGGYEDAQDELLPVSEDGLWRNQQSDRLAAAVRTLMWRRRSRAEFFPTAMLGEPAWDMLLDLYLAAHDAKRISVSSACIAAGVPATTALRWLARLEESGMVERTNDRNDRRRVYVEITEQARKAVDHWVLHIASA